MEPPSRNGNSPIPANRGLAPVKLSVVDMLVKWTKVIGSQKINKRGSCFLYQFVLTFFCVHLLQSSRSLV